MSYRDTNVFLSRTLSIDDVFSLLARDFDFNASKAIRVLITSLKKRSIRNENVENKCRENIKNNIENNEINENDENERNHKSEKSHRNSENVKNRNQDN
jgi:intergrase/recombinase